MSSCTLPKFGRHHCSSPKFGKYHCCHDHHRKRQCCRHHPQMPVSLSPRANGSTTRDRCRRRHRSRDSTANASVVCCRRYHHVNGSTTRHRRRQRSHDSHHHPRARRQYESIISAIGVCFATPEAVSVPPRLSKLPPRTEGSLKDFRDPRRPRKKTSSAWIDLAACPRGLGQEELGLYRGQAKGHRQANKNAE